MKIKFKTVQDVKENFPVKTLTDLQLRILNSPDAKLTKTSFPGELTVYSRTENQLFTFAWEHPTLKDFTITSIIL